MFMMYDSRRKHICAFCNLRYINLASLKAHLKNVHFLDDELLEVYAPKVSRHCSSTIECIICRERVISNFIHIEMHFKTHNITIEREMLKFDNVASFENWKSTMEMETTSQFTGLLKGYRNTFRKCRCTRSGSYSLPAKRKRNSRVQGTKKINGTCPAAISVKVDIDGILNVEFIKTHVGHDLDLSHIPLSKQCKENIIEKLKMGISTNDILNEVKNSNSNVSRNALLNKQDLKNIKRKFLNNTREEYLVHMEGFELFVKANMRDAEKGSFLFYKEPSTLSEECTNLKEEDFVLIIMTKSQGERLKKNGNKIIGMDSIHGFKYEFIVTTVFALDDFNEGFPCAFMISNQMNKDIVDVFVNKIKEAVGAITTQVFLSVMDTTLYYSWSKIMGVPSRRLIYTTDVNREWELNITKKIESKMLQSKCMKKLNILIKVTDITNFKHLLEEFMEFLKSDENLKEFFIYFKLYYLSSKQWAICYRVPVGVSTNMNIKRMQFTLKYYLSLCLKRTSLSTAMKYFINFFEIKLNRHLHILYGRKIRNMNRAILDQHRNSKSLASQFTIKPVTEFEWEATSTIESSKKCVYKIIKTYDNCNCQINCQQCREVCIHAYLCECITSALNWNICAHIHLLCQYLMQFEKTIVIESPSKSQNINKKHNIPPDSVTESNDMNEENVIVNNIPSLCRTREKNIIKQHVSDFAAKLCDMIDELEDSDDERIFMKKFVSAKAQYISYLQPSNNK